MLKKVDRVLAVDVGTDIVRGIVLVDSSPLEVGGYAQLERDGGTTGYDIVRLAQGLDPAAVLPIGVSFVESFSAQEMNDVVRELKRGGFESVSLSALNRASLSLDPALLDSVPDGLIASHDGMKRSDLAPAVAVGVELLRNDPVGTATTTSTAADELSVTPIEPPVETQSRQPQPEVEQADGTVAADVMAMKATDIAAPVSLAESKTSSRVPYLVLGALLLIGLIGFALTQLAGGSEVAESRTDVADAPAEDSEPAGSGAVSDPIATPDDVPAEAASAASDNTSDAPAADAAEAADEPDPVEAPEPTPEPTTAAVEQDDAGQDVVDTEAAVSQPATIDENADTTLSEQLSVNEAIYRDGKLYLSGPVQSQERIDYIVGLAAPLLGEENIVNDYYVDASETTQANGAVRIDDPLLFESGSTALNPDLLETLDLGVLVLQVFPQVTMQVIGHTDDLGSAGENQALSEARAQAVVDYMVAAGVAADRFEAFGLGETEPIADNFTDEGRAQNRRIDVALLNLLADAPSQ